MLFYPPLSSLELLAASFSGFFHTNMLNLGEMTQAMFKVYQSASWFINDLIFYKAIYLFYKAISSHDSSSISQYTWQLLKYWLTALSFCRELKEDLPSPSLWLCCLPQPCAVVTVHLHRASTLSKPKHSGCNTTLLFLHKRNAIKYLVIIYHLYKISGMLKAGLIVNVCLINVGPFERHFQPCFGSFKLFHEAWCW